MEPSLAKIATVLNRLRGDKLQILSMVTTKGITATEISSKFGTTEPAALKHLTELFNAGLLDREKEKRKTGAPRYRFFPKNFELIVKVNDGKLDATLDFKK